MKATKENFAKMYDILNMDLVITALNNDSRRPERRMGECNPDHKRKILKLRFAACERTNAVIKIQSLLKEIDNGQ